jgi:hypothetical protein
VLRIRDVYTGSDFFHPEPGSEFSIPDQDPYFLPIPNPGSGVKKAPDPGSEFATLNFSEVLKPETPELAKY